MEKFNRVSVENIKFSCLYLCVLIDTQVPEENLFFSIWAWSDDLSSLPDGCPFVFHTFPCFCE